jgi:hypothetical protein
MIPINPEAIGDPNQTPVVYLGEEVGRALGIRQRAPESSSPLDLEAIRARYDDYCERSLNEDDVFDAAMQCADDVSALLTALEEAQRERDDLRRKVADYESAITWDVTCFRCAAQLDALYADTVRRRPRR